MRSRRPLRIATDEDRSAPIVEETPTPIRANFLGFEERHFRTLAVNVASTIIAVVILYALFGSKIRGG